MAQDVLQFVETTRNNYYYLSGMKKGCMWLQSDLETEEIEFLQKLPRPLLAEITISVVQDLLKGNANGEEAPARV